MFTDFIGQEINVGDFVAYPGAGNTKAEYGMILYLITGKDLDKQKLKAVRLHAEYGQMFEGALRFHKSFEKNAIHSPSEGMLVRYAASTIENTNKLVVVQPSQRIKFIFKKILNSDKTIFDEITAKELGNWIHGSMNSTNPF
jgi:hypothetical protein